MNAEQRQHQGAARKIADQVDGAADAEAQRRIRVSGPAALLQRVLAADRQARARGGHDRALPGGQLQVGEFGEVGMGRGGADHFAVAPDGRVGSRAGWHLPGRERGEPVQRPGLAAAGEAQ